MTMRERLARAVAAVGDVPGWPKIWDDEVGRKNSYAFVDAMLDEMMKPSVGVYCVGGDAFHTKQALDPMPRAFGSMDHALAIWQSMVRAIKENK